jgi:hypothetical protein
MRGSPLPPALRGMMFFFTGQLTVSCGPPPTPTPRFQQRNQY